MRTVLDGLLNHLERHPDAVALRTLEGDAWTWREYADRAARFAGGLKALGVRRGDRVVMMLRNRLEFHVADLGALLVGATPVSIYNSSSPEQIAYLASHCGAVAAVTEGGDLADRVCAAAGDVPSLRHIVVVGDGPQGATSYDEVAAGPPVDVAEAAAAADPDELLTVIYTSGTTGPPKGVMIDHSNVLAAYRGLTHFMGGSGRGQRYVSYLPMAHVAERNVSHYNHLTWGGTVTPCADMAQLGAHLVAVRPTVLFGPPRVWEKLASGIQAAVAGQPADVRTRFAAA